jgi:hypothetical protein
MSINAIIQSKTPLISHAHSLHTTILTQINPKRRDERKVRGSATIHMSHMLRQLIIFSVHKFLFIFGSPQYGIFIYWKINLFFVSIITYRQIFFARYMHLYIILIVTLNVTDWSAECLGWCLQCLIKMHDKRLFSVIPAIKTKNFLLGCFTFLLWNQ